MGLILAILFATTFVPWFVPGQGFMILVGYVNDIFDLVQFLGKMKVAGASAVGGSKTRDHI